MAEPEVKMEPDGFPEQDEPSLFVNDDEPRADPNTKPTFESPTKESDNSNALAILFKLCEGKSRAQKVKILEEAARHGVIYFHAVEEVLERFESDFPSCRLRLVEISKNPIYTPLFLPCLPYLPSAPMHTTDLMHRNSFSTRER